jgi:hypothetical protein
MMELLREGVARTDRKGKLGPRKPDPEQIGDIEDEE